MQRQNKGKSQTPSLANGAESSRLEGSARKKYGQELWRQRGQMEWELDLRRDANRAWPRGGREGE